MGNQQLPKTNRLPSDCGQPQVKIDWKKVDELLEAGCLGTEIAGYLGISDTSLYRHTEAYKGMSFSEYRQHKVSKGDSILRNKQYQKAIKGDNTMLLWLGKNRLKQRDKEPELVASNEQIDELIEGLKSMKKPESNDSSS